MKPIPIITILPEEIHRFIHLHMHTDDLFLSQTFWANLDLKNLHEDPQAETLKAIECMRMAANEWCNKMRDRILEFKA